MGKLVKLLIVLVVIAGAGWLLVNQMNQGESDSTPAAEGDPPVRVEEKYGFTSEGVGG